MEKSESIKNLALALCNFQGTVEKIVKGATNPFFKSKYANLADILDVIREPLQTNDLSFVQFPEGENALTTMLMHSSGEWIQATYTMKPTKNDPQGQGSAITYQRRYALGAILGLNIDDDDDGNNASKQPTKPQVTTADKLTDLPWLNPNTKEWDGTIKALSQGKTLEDAKKAFRISKTNQDLLLSELSK